MSNPKLRLSSLLSCETEAAIVYFTLIHEHMFQVHVYMSLCMWCVSARIEVKGGWSSVTSIYNHTAMEV